MSLQSGHCLSCHNTVHLAVQEQELDLRLRLMEQTMCGICWCPLVNSDTCPAQVQTMLPTPPEPPLLNSCGHVFHLECLNSRAQFYVTANFHCPLCGELIQDTRSIHLIDGDTRHVHEISSRCSSGYNSPSSYTESIVSTREKTQHNKPSHQRQLNKGSPILDRRNIEKQVYQSYNLDRRSLDRNIQDSSDRASLERNIRQCSVGRSVERNIHQSPNAIKRNDYQSPNIQRRSIDRSIYQSPNIERRKLIESCELSPQIQRQALDRKFQFPSLERRKMERSIRSPSPTPNLPIKLHSLDRRKLESNVQSMQHFSSLKKKNIIQYSRDNSPVIGSEITNKTLTARTHPKTNNEEKKECHSSGQNSTGMINNVIGSLDKLKIDLITKR